jgi:glutamate decarboxylase
MVFHVSYLGGDMPTLALNFSRPGAQVLLQYYQFLRLGREGYREIQQNSIDVATYLSSGIADIGPFELMSKGDTIPVFAWVLKDGYTDKWTLYDLADRLRMKGWLVPAYPMADDMADVVLQRIVVKVGLSRDLASALLSDIKGEVQFLDALDAPLPREASSGSHFHH